MNTDLILFWHAHNSEPVLSHHESLLFCLRTPQVGFSLASLVQRWKRKRRARVRPNNP
jgi:hypothetical protein